MINVKDAEDHFRADEYVNAAAERRPVIYISPNDIYSTHSIISDNLDIIVRISLFSLSDCRLARWTDELVCRLPRSSIPSEKRFWNSEEPPETVPVPNCLERGPKRSPSLSIRGSFLKKVRHSEPYL